MRLFRERLTYANVASTLALVIAVGSGGAAVAAVAINSVGSPQIIDGAVKSRDLGTSSVGSGKILNGGVRSADIADNSITAMDLANLSWHNLVLVNGWETFSLRSPAWAIDAQGILHLRGAIRGGSSVSSSIFARLPAGIRPSTDIFLPTLVGSGALGSIDIASNGDMHAITRSSAYDLQFDFTSLEGVSWAR